MVFQPKNEVSATDPSQVLVDGYLGTELIGIGGFHYSAEGAVVGLTSKNIFQNPPPVGVGYGPTKLVAGQPQLLTAVYNETSQIFDLYLNGINAGNTRKYTTLDVDGLTLENFVAGARNSGSFSGFDGMISEMIFYQTSISNTNRLEVESYLSNKFLVPSSNMAFHFSADTGVWADSAATTSATDGLDVQLWQDQSGNSIDLVPSHPGINRAATFVANGINGRPALQFNNETDPMKLAQIKCRIRLTPEPSKHCSTCFNQITP